MARLQQISYFWKDNKAARGYKTGVSLHSHTNQSRETLDFVANWSCQFPFLRPWLEKAERGAQEGHGVAVQYSKAYWTPPLTPILAYELESKQIQNRLGLNPLVSITDHDSIQAPLLLRTVPSARHIPVSLEWTAPFGGDQAFHFGIHNLPSDQANAWMQTLADYTANPGAPRLTEILEALHALPNTLIIFNHPEWDLYLIGREKAAVRVHDFLSRNRQFLHALELNGLRNWEENRRVKRLAEKWNMLLISGGDRHGCEPNANVNLTNATSFTEFAHEVREGHSHVMFMPQYAEPWKHRVLNSTLDAIRDYPDFPQGSQLWDERVFHPDRDGVIRSLAELWPSGRAPWYMHYGIRFVRAMGTGTFSKGLRLAWSDAQDLKYRLGEETA
ncbi:MAG: PHP domain-containing protein [Acidobacteriaceae bacterium]